MKGGIPVNLRISDLLDDWVDGSVELSPPPEVSLDRIRARTRKQLAVRRPKRRALLRLLACAALAAALTVSAMAAYQLWGPGDLFDAFFTLESAPLNDGQKALLDKIGTTDLPASVSNGTTLTPLAAISDEHNLYLRLRVEAPEGTVLPDMGEQEDHVFLDVELRDTQTGDRLNWGMQKARFLPDSTPGDHVVELVFLLYGWPGGVNWNDGAEKTLYLSDLLLYPDVTHQSGDYVLLEGDWSFDLTHFYQSQAVEVDTGGATYVERSTSNTLTLESLALSPLSASYRIRCTDSSLISSDHTGISLVLTDGTTVPLSCGLGTFGPDFMEGVTAFDSPIPLDQIDHVLFGDLPLSLPDSPSGG